MLNDLKQKFQFISSKMKSFSEKQRQWIYLTSFLLVFFVVSVVIFGAA